ncbi:hypothetical protein JZ785_14860 [Alicyclobacillus curvatus]|jgi:hypothetical protein|nr:hypothetical protein JZ785_14860 [Alicyclobacillus curvatus]
MKTVISFSQINVNAGTQNSGVFIGKTRIPGWDASHKSNAGHAGIFGFSNFESSTVNMTMDGQELVDGIINDQDIKPMRAQNL